MVFWRIKSYFIFGLTCFVTVASMKLSISPNINETTLNVYKALEKIVSKCYHDKVNPLIMYNLMDQQLRDYSSLEHPMSLILVNERFRVNDTQAQWTNYYPTTATFILVVDDLDRLQKTVVNIYHSFWSSNEPYFILVGLTTCRSVSRALSMMGRGKFLSAIFLCYNNQEDVIQLYTFNPFTDRAPYPWIKVGSDQTWTLFRRNYWENNNACLNLNYDKTKYLDGYQIKAIGVPKPGVTWITNKSYDSSSLPLKLPYFNAQFALNIFLKMNITPIIDYSQSLSFKTHQFILNSHYPSQLGKGVYASYPFRQTSSVIITQKRPFLSTEEKINSFYSLSSIFLVSTSFGIFIIVLMINKRQPCSSATLELIRLLVTTSIEQPLNRLSIRIYLFGMLWLIMILNATFQGHLAKFLTRPERQNVDSITDLKRFNYKVYVNVGSFPSMNDTLSEMQLSVTTMMYLNGYEVVLNDSQAAYITASFRAYEPAYKHQLYVSDPCSLNYQIFLTSLPIIKRIDEISSRYAESGLQDYWDKYAIEGYKKNLTNTEEMETSPQVRPLTVVDILFMIKFLAIGLGVSFVVFLIEIVVGRQSKKNINKHKTPPSVKKSEQTSIEVDVVSL